MKVLVSLRVRSVPLPLQHHYLRRITGRYDRAGWQLRIVVAKKLAWGFVHHPVFRSPAELWPGDWAGK